MSRNTSRFMVKVFDPNRDPSVAQMLNAEIQRDARVTAVKASGKFGMVTTAKGTFWLDEEGCGPVTTIDARGCLVELHREFIGGSFEPASFASATYSLEECKACATGEEVTLDKFIGCGRRKDANFEQWEAALELADKQ